MEQKSTDDNKTDSKQTELVSSVDTNNQTNIEDEQLSQPLIQASETQPEKRQLDPSNDTNPSPPKKAKTANETSQQSDESSEEDTIFEVEKILKKRKKGNKVLYYVKWVGYDSKHNSWVAEVTLFFCSHLCYQNDILDKKLIEDFEKPKSPRIRTPRKKQTPRKKRTPRKKQESESEEDKQKTPVKRRTPRKTSEEPKTPRVVRRKTPKKSTLKTPGGTPAGRTPSKPVFGDFESPEEEKV